MDNVGRTVESITRRNGIAGQVSYDVTVMYDYSNTPERYGLVGSIYGTPGPVVIVTALGYEVLVTEPSRFGERFDREWVERFATNREA